MSDLVSDTTDRYLRNGVRAEAMCHVLALHGPLTERETMIAEAAARSAYRWTLREVINDLEKKVDGS